MTIEEVSELYYINKEIAQIQREIAELKKKNYYKKPVMSDMPKGSRGTDIRECVDSIKALEDSLHYNLLTLQRKRVAAEEFLQSVEDAEIRLIMRLRVVNNMSWENIGKEVGMSRTTVSRKFYQYFQQTCTQCTSELWYNKT